MNKETIIAELIEISDSKYFCKKSHISEYLGVSLRTVNEYIAGVPSVNGRLFHIPEVADALMTLVPAIEIEEKSN